MEIKGLVINFLGDSITEGCGTTGPEKVFHQLIKNEYGLKDAYNYGLGGTRIARQVVPVKEKTRYDLNFELRADTMQKNADAIVVFGGTNDYGHGDAPFGTIDSNDIYTFCGAVNSLITKLHKDFPKAKIIFMTPIHRLRQDKPSFPDGKILKDYVDALITICNKREIDVIDLFKINPLNPMDKNIIPDGLHPNNNGHKILSKVIAEELIRL